MHGTIPALPPHLVHIFPSFGIGGVPIRIATVMNHLGRRARHTVVALDGRFDAASRIAPDVPLELRPLTLPRYGIAGSLRRIGAELRDLRPDLLLTYNWGAVEWALANTLRRRSAHLHLESGFGPEEADGRLPRRDLLRRLALARADGVVVPSHRLLGIARDSWRVPARTLLHIPNGIDCARFSAPADTDLARRLAVEPGAVVVGTVAPLRPEKNLGRLLRVFAALPRERDLRLLIVGDGPERPGLERLAAELGIAARILFAGNVERVETVLGLIDVFVITSDTEQMPNALLQAMAAGRAVASVDVGDIAAMLPAAARPLVVPKTDEAALAAAVLRLADDADRRAAAGAENRRHVAARYGLDRMLAAYEGLVARLLPAERPLLETSR
ncbi:glycosyltransferase [Rhodocista pekingensis]|uniref:Glycosyltransferase n=1 Tax=Rhodocista pekingensis TaxID=201185 RepID=A0ABW2L0Y1_9PROT